MRIYTHLTPVQALVTAIQQARQAQRLVRFLQQEAQSTPLPTSLRPACAADIVTDNVIWYPQYDHHLAIVDEVYDATEDFKGYNDLMSNCTYGLHGAFVELK